MLRLMLKLRKNKLLNYIFISSYDIDRKNIVATYKFSLFYLLLLYIPVVILRSYNVICK